MIRAMHIPILAMWKDESVVFPNPAARRLLAVNADPTSEDSYDFLSRFKPWSTDFSRQLEDNDNPIVSLCRTQKAFSRWQIGLINERTGKKSIYDVSGHPVFDEKTNVLLEQKKGKQITFLPDKNELMLGESHFRKIK